MLFQFFRWLLFLFFTGYLLFNVHTLVGLALGCNIPFITVYKKVVFAYYYRLIRCPCFYNTQ